MDYLKILHYTKQMQSIRMRHIYPNIIIAEVCFDRFNIVFKKSAP